ncbi:MAG: hypothetical protein WCP17_03395 [bacterium]
MEKIKRLFAHKIFKVLIWAFLILVGAFVVLVIVRAFYFYNLDKTNAQVAKIHATKLTLDDVMGKNLPPDPGAEADKTVAGIDANNNGIRDDVELAVFKEYPNSAKTRAVLLQYALVLQMQMTLPIVNKETVTATVEDKSRANLCMWNLIDVEKYENFVKKFQINTEQRNKYLDDFYKYMGSYTASRQGCDIDLSTLLN